MSDALKNIIKPSNEEISIFARLLETENGEESSRVMKEKERRRMLSFVLVYAAKNLIINFFRSSS